MYTYVENTEDIAHFLDSFVPEDAHPLLSAYLFIALAKPLEKDARFLTSSNNPMRRFDPALVDADSRSTISQARDWIADAIKKNKSWIFSTDGLGRPVRLQQISSLDDVQSRIKKDAQKFGLQAQFSEAVVKLRQKENDGHIRIKEVLPDGSCWIQLLTAQALDEESSMMGTCVGDGNYDSFIQRPNAAIYSLRDALGRGHMTVQVEDGTMLQCRGKENAPPVEKYMQTVTELIQKEKWVLGTDLALACLILQDGKYYSLREIPPEFCHEGDFVLNSAKWLKEMPKKFSATGDVTLRSCESIKRIKESITSGKAITIDGCKDITSIIGDLSAKGSITINQNGELQLISGRLSAQVDINILQCDDLEFTGNDLSARNSIRFKTCPRLLSIGSRIYAGNDVIISLCSRLQSIGNNISVGGNLRIANCQDFLRIGENLHVEKNLVIESCPKMAPLPRSTTVRGSITCNDRRYQSIEELNAALEARDMRPSYPRPLAL